MREERAATTVQAMFAPVECRWCHRIHDSGRVEVIARYTDCSVWRCPHCGNQVDDRPEGWGGSAFPIDKRTGRRR
jgi:hypothetical protein